MITALTVLFVLSLLLYTVYRLLIWRIQKSSQRSIVRAGMEMTGLLSGMLKKIREEALNQNQCDVETVRQLGKDGFLTKVKWHDSLRKKYKGAHWKAASVYFPKKYLFVFSKGYKLVGFEESQVSYSDLPRTSPW